ncbi:MAG: radical SAM/SPASM domain-containing protein [Acidimicrobiia bacterium]|nr:radical SAM/SPASM domain-containing protein [Acidimicrobiia bacterium]
MESIYYVMSWLCHRRCAHCYEDRFRPYHGEELVQVVEESRANYARVIGNFPERMTYLDVEHGGEEKAGSVILAGGEILLEPVRETVLYPALRLLQDKYRERGGVKLIVQTTGDVLTAPVLKDLIERKVWMISVSGIDEYHAGLEEESAREELVQKLTEMFEEQGVRHFAPVAGEARDAAGEGPFYHFFGATPDSWIGKLWPRGRAWENELSVAGIRDNFCNRWSGGLNFLDHRHSGSEVSVDPAGNVYPCCVKTKLPVGNLLEEPLEEILERLRGNPVYEAISMGHPERMGISRGWSVERFLKESEKVLESGRVYRNLCIGCDRFHEEVLAEQPLVRIGMPAPTR